MYKGKKPVIITDNGIKIMERQASDNKYLHKDFHISQNILMGYIYRNFGKVALLKYLEQFASAYFKHLNEKLKSGETDALLDYFTEIYKKEEWPVKITSGEGYIEVLQDSCPGISHIRSKGGEPCPHYRETYNTVYKTICRGTPFVYELEYFNDETGACKQLFRRKEVKL